MLSSVCISYLLLACLAGGKDIVLEAADAVRLHVVDIRSLDRESLRDLRGLLLVYESLDEDVNLLATDTHLLGIHPDVSFESCIEVRILVADAVLVLEEVHHGREVVIATVLAGDVRCLVWVLIFARVVSPSEHDVKVLALAVDEVDLEHSFCNPLFRLDFFVIELELLGDLSN